MLLTRFYVIWILWYLNFMVYEFVFIKVTKGMRKMELIKQDRLKSKGHWATHGVKNILYTME